MADVKVPALLHKMSKAAQKAWYKKNNMTMPSEVEGGGRSAAAAKRVVAPAPRKQMAAAPQSVRAMNTARQQAYYAKGGRQPIGAGGSGGSSSMAGSNMSTAKGIVAGIKAGFNPKVSLNPYEGMTAKEKKSMKKEEVEQIEEGNPANKAKKKEAIRQLGLKAMKAGKVDPARGYIPQRAGREQLKKEETKMNEVTKKEAEETLGGPVKTKPKMPPGKQPEGYRYVRALARRAMKAGLKKEEVEQVDEAGYQVVGTTKDKETFRSKVHPKKADALSTHYKMTKSRKYKDIKLVKVQEEVEQMDEARRRMSAAEKLGRAFDQEQQRSALSRQRGLDLLKQKDTEKMQNKLASGKMSPSEVMTKLKKEETEESTMKYIEEKLTAADPASKWISDFVKSDNPKFAGKSKKERIQQALGAYYAKKRGTNEETEQVDEVNRNKTKTDDYGGRYLDSINRDKEIKELERKISKMSPNDGGGRYLAGLKLDKMKAMKEEVEQVDEVNARNSFVATQQALTPRAKDVKASVGTTRRDAAVTNKYARRISKLSGGDYSKQDVKGNLKSLAKEEAEGKVAVTPKEKSLAAHHGDKTKITFGDVLKARLKSAAAKKMGK